MVSVDKPMTGMINENYYNYATVRNTVDDFVISHSQTDSQGRRIVKLNSGAKAIIEPGQYPRICERHDSFHGALRYEIEGDGVTLDVSEADLSKAIEGMDYPKGTKPAVTEIYINGSKNKILSKSKTNVQIKGSNNTIETGDFADSVEVVRGSGNVIKTGSGNDRVAIESGVDNKTYLGDGVDTYTAPKGDESNVAYSGLIGHDNIKGGKYIKDKNNKREFSITKSAENAYSSTCSFTSKAASKVGGFLHSFGTGLYNWFFNGGGSDEQWENLDNLIKDGYYNNIVKPSIGDIRENFQEN